MSNGNQQQSANLALEILEIFLQQPNVQVDVCDKDGRQPLLWAASAGAVKAVLVCFFGKININARIDILVFVSVHSTDSILLYCIKIFSPICMCVQLLVKSGARVESADK